MREIMVEFLAMSAPRPVWWWEKLVVILIIVLILLGCVYSLWLLVRAVMLWGKKEKGTVNISVRALTFLLGIAVLIVILELLFYWYVGYTHSYIGYWEIGNFFRD